MPYASNQGIRIHYEVEGQGPPLVLLHGLGVSLTIWYMTGFGAALRNDYQLILIDVRGHGASDKPHDLQAYSMAVRVADVLAVLDDLRVPKAHFCGYSMGGSTGWGVAKYAAERFYSLVIGGASPQAPLPEGRGLSALFSQGTEAFLSSFGSIFGPRWTPQLKDVVLANDLEALTALTLAAGQEDLHFGALLPTITLPCLLFGGDRDPFFAGTEACAGRIPRATCVTLAGLDHIEACYRSDLVAPQIRKFLAEVGEG
jgi:pimeloyl-ACP methyl ester carboxylesterase